MKSRLSALLRFYSSIICGGGWLLGVVPASLAQAPPPPPKPALWASDALTKVLRAAQPPTTGADALRIRGARREIVSGQAVFRSGNDLAGAQATVTDLRHRSAGATIPAQAIGLQWVRYIDISRNSDIPPDERVAQAPTSIPDPFWEASTVAVKAGEAQPLWIEVRVPADARTGDYDGRLRITGDGVPVEMPVELRVWDFEIPPERHLSVVNWWQFPGPAFADHGPDDWELLRRFVSFLVEHRQTDLAVELSRIGEAGDAQKGFSHDTSRLERYAEVVFEAGIRQVHLHSSGSMSAAIRWGDTPTGSWTSRC